jgi:hypothetical protein
MGEDRTHLLPPRSTATLLTIEHAFYIDKLGADARSLAEVPHAEGLGRERLERQEQVIVVRPDGSELTATAQINMTHLNIRDPDVPLRARWPNTVWLTDRKPEEVPVGSKILVDPAVRAAILGE